MRGEFKTPNYSEERFNSLIRRVANEDLSSSIRLQRNVARLKESFNNTKYGMNYLKLSKSPEEISGRIDRIINPGLGRIRDLPTRDPIININSGTTAQAPSLPTNITGNPVNPNVISQNFGNRFNLTQSLNPEQKRNFLFD